jgi:hypothetical protein
MRGLAPRIDLLRKKRIVSKMMDRRVKPGDDPGAGEIAERPRP